YEEFEKAKTNKRKLQSLIVRISNLKIFDPACGSGNFLIIAYKELRKLEIKIFKQIDILAKQKSFTFSEIRLAQFYGIELDDFAHEVAKLSLWLAEHQMNLEFFKAFGRTAPSLPLQNGGNIVHGNATRVDWAEVCPKVEGDEIYILGNPPYQGSGKQNKEQKEDMDFVFLDIKSYKKLDYIACWFYKGAKYIKNIDAKIALVTTNSITQGEQVGLLWSHIFKLNLEINFAYQSFKWKNNAKNNAGVSVMIIGLRNIEKKQKYIYQNLVKKEVKHINAYIIDAGNIIVSALRNNISMLPPMIKGSSLTDNGHLTLSETEKDEIININPKYNFFIKKYIGNKDFMNGIYRYVLWITDKTRDDAYLVPQFKERFEKVAEFRLSSKKKATVKKAKIPYLFDEIKHKNMDSIVVPQTGSEKRDYLPIGFVDKNTVVSNGLRIIYTQEIWIFSILSSKIHMIWVKAVAGRMKTDMQYSNTICYNTFPFPNITQKQKDELTEHTYSVLDEREKHSEKTLAQLYDPNKMPQGLKKAHHELDLAVERCYRVKPFGSDEERLAYLFGLYEEMVGNE
ncbi:MAG TPA: class I SAM-dependent DNA methyltransferase, partial [Campylobacterales bacterium]|nr:class I SAM-dependent DNA methyltransferase [Campylobacterales bacterium]